MFNEVDFSISTYGVIGHPVSHSLSPFIHTLFASQTNISLQYLKIEAPIAHFESVVKEFLQKGGKGLNVTLPFKERAWQLVDQCTPRGEVAKAINTLAFDEQWIIKTF